MRRYNGYKPEMSAGAREILPAGGYVVKIISARAEQSNFGERLVIGFDVEEGDFRGFFKKDFDSNNRDDKKWRGVFRVNWPPENAPENEKWKVRAANDVMGAIEASNPGYKWDFNEQTLRGKLVGALYRNKEWEYNGMNGWTTECCKFTDVNSIRSGDFKTPKDKPLNKSNQANNNSYGNYSQQEPQYQDYSAVDGDLPF